MAALSKRSAETLAALDKPWKFAAATTYDPDTNPGGLISFATAENVRYIASLCRYSVTLVNTDPPPCRRSRFPTSQTSPMPM